MATPQPIKSAFGSQPSSLSGSIPSETAEAEFENELAAFDIPTVNKPSSAMVNQVGQFQDTFRESGDPRNSANQLMNQTGEEGISPEELEAEASMQKLQQSTDANFDPNAELTDPIQRGILSYAVTPREAIGRLEKKFGSGNSRLTDRGVEFRPTAKEKWRVVDKETFSFFNDLIADNVRTIQEGFVENAGRIGGFVGGATEGALEGAAKGALVGSVVPGVGTVLAGTAGGITEGLMKGLAFSSIGGGLGSAAAVTSGDFVQEVLLSIERDPDRSRTGEAATAAAIGAGFFMVAKFSSSKLARAKLKAKAFGETMQSVKERVSQVTENINILNGLGIIKDGKQIKLLPNQMAGDIIPDLQAVAKELGTEDGFNNFVRQQGELIEDGFYSVAELAGNVKGVRDPNFASKISDSVFSTRAVEGKTIGEFREAALAKSKGAKYQLPRARDAMQSIFNDLGVPPTSLRPGQIPIIGEPSAFQKLTTDTIMETYPDLTRDQATSFLGIIKKFDRLGIDKDNFNLKNVDNEYTVLRNKLDLLFKSRAGLPLAHKLLPLKNSLRDDWADIIGKELGPEGQKDYLAAMGRFKEVNQHLGNLTSALTDSEISREAFVKTVFNKGTKALPQIKAIRTLIQEQSPELWRDLTGEYLESAISGKTDKVTKAVNWKAVRNQIDGIGKEMKDEIFAGTNYNSEGLDALLSIGEHFQKFPTPPLPKQSGRSLPAKVIRGIVVLASQTLATQKADTAADLVNALGGKDNALAAYLNAGGINDIMRLVPKVRRPDMLTKLHQVVDLSLDDSRTSRLIKNAGVPAIKTGIRVKVTREDKN